MALFLLDLNPKSLDNDPYSQDSHERSHDCIF